MVAVGICSTFMLQMLYIVSDDLTLTHIDVFTPFKVDFRQQILSLKAWLTGCMGHYLIHVVFFKVPGMGMQRTHVHMHI